MFKNNFKYTVKWHRPTKNKPPSSITPKKVWLILIQIKFLKKSFINHCIVTTGSAININQKAENEHLQLEWTRNLFIWLCLSSSRKSFVELPCQNPEQNLCIYSGYSVTRILEILFSWTVQQVNEILLLFLFRQVLSSAECLHF